MGGAAIVYVIGGGSLFLDGHPDDVGRPARGVASGRSVDVDVGVAGVVAGGRVRVVGGRASFHSEPAGDAASQRQGRDRTGTAQRANRHVSLRAKCLGVRLRLLLMVLRSDSR
jgi:hypothetical protein